MKFCKGYLLSLLLSLLFLFQLFAGACAAEGQGSAEYGILNAAGDMGLTGFSAALEKTGLAETLDNRGVLLFGNGSFLVFAPRDEAFANVTGLDMMAVMENRTELRRVLGYHIVWIDGPGGANANLSAITSLRTAEGENLTLDHGNGTKVNGAEVVDTRTYDSGIVYVIDRVLIPRKSAAGGVVGAAEALGVKKFAAAIKSAGLVEKLNGQGPAGIESLSEGPFTIFAPSDAAFGAAKVRLDSISKKEDGLRTLLGFHIVDARALENRTDSGSMKTLSGDSLAVDIGAGLVGGAAVQKSERYDNSIIYVIDQVLVPVRLSM